MDRSSPHFSKNGSVELPVHRASSQRLLLLWLLPLAFLLLFYFYPLGSILRTSLARSEGGLGTPFSQALTSPIVRKALSFTIWQATLSTLLTLLLGLPGAYLLARYEFRGKSFLQALAGIPFVLPTARAAWVA
jgi:thiamine transport system permease protein